MMSNLTFCDFTQVQCFPYDLELLALTVDSKGKKEKK